MKKTYDKEPHLGDTIHNPAEDRTGRDRMVTNVLWSWAGYLVTIVAGFVTPRMIDRYIGQFSLGVWDFCWSIVSYLSLSFLGAGSSVNRFVAKYRASGDTDNLCKAVSSVICIQLGLTFFVVLGTAVMTWILPYYFSHRLVQETLAAQWVVATLGLSVAIIMANDPSRGVITGCHRWDFHNGINAFSNAIIFGGMIVVLFLGKGLRALGFVVLCATIITESLRFFIAHRTCPELRVRLSFVKWSTAKEMILFSWKIVIASLSPFVLVQITNILVVSALGPAALAVLARPIALIRHIGTIVNKLAFITTPTAGALQESGNTIELKKFLLDTARYGVAIVMPITIFMIFFGDIILTLWMGPNYAHGILLTILALGYFLPVSQGSVIRILIGLNLHGRIGVISFLTNLTIFALSVAIVSFLGWSLVKASVIVAISLTFGDGIIVPIYASRKLQISLLEYFRHVFCAPLICCLALAAIFFFIRILFPTNIYTSLCFGTVAGGLFAGRFYWRYIFTERIQTKILKRIYKILPQF